MASDRVKAWKVTCEGGAWFVHEPKESIYKVESEARYRAANPLVLDLVQRITSGQDTMQALHRRAAKIAAVLEGRG